MGWVGQGVGVGIGVGGGRAYINREVPLYYLVLHLQLLSVLRFSWRFPL